MNRKEKYTPTRRTLLSAMGTGLAGGLLGGQAAAQSESGYVLVQGEECVPIRPVRGRLSVETFYDYQLPQKFVSEANGATAGTAAAYSSAGTEDLQRAQTSDLFLYQGPQGLSLVVVHGSLDSSDGGAVTFEMTGLPKTGEWVVKDDRYRNPETGDIAPSNYDRWSVEGSDHRIDWTWGSGGTDGGAFRNLGDDFEITIDPRFNESAPLFGEHYQGTVADWQFLSGSAGVSERVSLSMDQPITLKTGSCGSSAAAGATGQRNDQSSQGESGQDQSSQDQSSQDQTESEGRQSESQQTDEQQNSDQQTENQPEDDDESETDEQTETEQEEKREEEQEEEQEKREEEREEQEEKREERREEREEKREEQEEKREERQEEREEKREEQEEKREERREEREEEQEESDDEEQEEEDDSEEDEDGDE